MSEQFTREEITSLKQAFSEIKAEQDVFLQRNLASIFIETEFYDNAQLRGKCLLVGRKGSGKTAVLYGHKKKHANNYYNTQEIDIDELPFPALFNFFYQDFLKSKERLQRKSGLKSESLDFIQPEKLAHYAWMNSIVGVCVLDTARDLLMEDKAEKFLSDIDRKILENTLTELAKNSGQTYESVFSKLPQNGAIVFSLLLFSFRELQDVIEEVLDQDLGKLSLILSTILTRLSIKLRKDSKIDIYQASLVIGKYLKNKNKQVLLTLDRFDDFYDSFYAERPIESRGQNGRFNTETENKKDLLHLLLDGLILAARDISQSPELVWIDTLFTIPMDKFLEIHLRERMDMEQNHLLFVEWTPRELFDFANVRIADALGLEGEDRKYAWFRIFPRYIKNGNPKVSASEESFFYVTRHTLWKPRELQVHIKGVIEAIERNNNRPIDEEEIHKCIRESSKEIIRQEFHEEFIREYPGIGSTLKHFENSKVKSVMKYSDYIDLISGSKLTNEITRPDDIAIRHFQMGLVGVRRVRPKEVRGKNPTVAQDRANIEYCFSYNSMQTNPFTDKSDVVIHPMFFDQLGISHEESYIVNEMSWDMYPKNSDARNKNS